MKVTVPGQKLHTFIKAAVSVAQPADDRQILRNVLLEATTEGLEITATDTIVGLWVKIPLEEGVVVDKPGRAVVNANNFQRVIATVANRDVTVTATPRRLKVSAGGSKFQLATEDSNDFPKIARFSKRKPFITIKSSDLTAMVARTAYCAHDEASFQLMHGLLVVIEDADLKMVATNGQRLAVSELRLEGEPEQQEVVIPAEAADTMKLVIDSDTPTVDVQWMASFLNVRTTRGEVSIRALAGNYPLFGRGIPEDLTGLRLDRKSLIEILKQTTAIKSPTSNFVALNFQKDRMVFTSVADGAGEAEVVYDYLWDGEVSYGITINPDFMIETLAKIRGEDVLFEVGNEMTPTILRELSPDGGLKSFCVYAVVRQ